MVLPGQFLERPALIEAGELVLEGLSHRGRRRPGLLLCPPIRGGGGMDAPVVAELAWAAARAGHPSLRFQHRGVGGSQGAPDGGAADEDGLAALRHLVATVGGPVAVAGVGEGAATALAVARARPAEVVAVALVAPAGPLALDGLAAPVLVVLPEVGAALEAATLRTLSGAGGRVEIIPGADPGFRAGLPRLGRAVADWLSRSVK